MRLGSAQFIVLASSLFIAPLAQPQDSAHARLPRRLHITAELQVTLDSGKAKLGDLVKMEVLAPELEEGVVIIPKGAKLFGRVSVVVPHAGSASESQLSVVIERAEWKGKTIPLNAFIVAVGQTRLTRAFSANGYCWDPLDRQTQRDAITNPECMEAARQRTGSGETARESPALTRDIELRLFGNPPNGSVLVSRKRNVVLRKSTAFVLRNADPAWRRRCCDCR